MTRSLVPLAILLLIAVSFASLLAGSVWLSPEQAMASLFSGQDDLAGLIIREVRLPRLMLSAGIGAVLGLSGAALQGLLRNPLAEPGVLGISSGAALGAVIAIYYGFAAQFTLAAPIFALVGAFATAGIALLLSRGGGVLSLILSGVAVSSIAAAGIAVALNLAPNPYAAYEIMTWLMGSLADRSWDHVKLAAPFMMVGALMLLSTGRALDALTLGEAQAESMGVAVGRISLFILLGTALSVGAATAVAGSIGFVGLIAPHLVRPMVGYRPGKLLIPAALTGAILVTLADIGTRTLVFGNQPLNLGVLISIVGAPFFLWLVLYVRRRAA